MIRHLRKGAALAVCPLVPVAALAFPADPDGVCDPQEEALARCFTSPGGFVVEVVPDATGAFPMIDDQGNSVFSYLVTGPGATGGSCQGVHDVSHADLLLPVCPENPLVIVDSSGSTELLPNGDPSCGFGQDDPTTDVLKWDIGTSCDGSRVYTIVLEGQVDAAPTSFLLKAANDCDVATILGPACTEPCEGSIGDFVWLDLNGDGLQDPGEPGIEGVTLLLTNEGGVQVGETQTGAGGAYEFDQVCPGNYTVTVDTTTLPESVAPSPCMAGDPTLDNDCSPAGVTLTDQVPNRPDIDFGYTPVPYVYCESEPNSTGANAEITYDGNPSISENQFFVTVTGLPPNQPGWFFYGTEAVDMPFGDGVRCIGGQVNRYRKVAIEITGETDVQLDFTFPPLDTIVPGVAYYFQLWYRDPMSGGAGYSTSDALSVIFAP